MDKAKPNWLSPAARLAIALLVAGPVAGAVIGVGLAPFSDAPYFMDVPTNLQFLHWIGFMASWGAIFGVVIGWPARFVVGFPGHAALCRRRWTRLSTYVLAGLCAGMMGTVLASFGSLLTNSESATTLAATILLPGSAICAAILWLIRRPDRDIVVTEIGDEPTS